MTGAAAASPRRRRAWRWLAWSLVALVLARIGLAVGLPFAIDRAAAALGCRAEYRSLDLSLCGLSVCLRGLVLHDRTASTETAPRLRLDELALDVDQWALLRGRLLVLDAAVSGLHVQLEPRSDGSLSLPFPGLDQTPTPPSPAPAAPPAPTTAPWQPPSFALPLQIRSLRVHDLRAAWRTPDGTRHSAALDLVGRDVGDPLRSGTVQLRVHAPGLLDHLQLDAELACRETELQSRFALELRGAQLAALPLAPQLRAWLGGARVLDGRLNGHATAAHALDQRLPLDVTAGLELTLDLDREPVLHSEFAVGPLQRNAAAATLPWHARLSIADAIDRLELADGQVFVAAGRWHVAMHLHGTGLHGRRCAPLLAAAGAELPNAGLELSAHCATAFDPGTGRIDAALRDLRCGEAGRVATLAECAVRGFDPAALQIERLSLDGPQLRVERLADGRLQCAGICLGPPTSMPQANPPAAAPRTAAAAPPPAHAVPQFLLQELQWRNAELGFVDRTTAEPTALAVQLTADGSQLGCAAASGTSDAVGALQATLAFPGHADRLQLALQLRGLPDRPHLAADLRGTDLTLAPLAPWLLRLGVQPTWRAAALRAGAELDAEAADDGWSVRAALQPFALTDRGTELLACRELRLAPSRFTNDGGMALGAVTLDGLRAHWLRQAAGEQFAGLRLLPAESSPPNPTADPPHAAGAAPAAPARWQTGAVLLRDAALHVLDQRQTTVATAAAVQLTAELGPAAPGATVPLRIECRVPGGLERLELAAACSLPTAAGFTAHAAVTAAGIRGAGLAPWLPAGLEVVLADGHGGVQCDIRQDASSGLTAELRALRLSDGDHELLAFDALHCRAPALGPELVHVAELSLRGLRGASSHDADALHLPGLRLAAPPPEPAPDPTASAEADVPAPAAPAATADQGRARSGFPAVQLDAVHFELARWQHRDRTAADSVPLALSGAVRLAAPWRTAEPVADSAPLRWLLEFAAAPVLTGLRLELACQPLRLQPQFDLRAQVGSFDADRCGEVWPALRERLGATAGPLALELQSHLRLGLRRADPWRWDLRRPFGLDLQLEQLAVRDPAGTPLARLAGLDLAVGAIDLAGRDVRVRHLELDAPECTVVRKASRVEVAGLWFASAPPTDAPPAAAEPRPAAGAAAEPPAVAIQHLRLQDLAIDYRDTTTTPPTHLPLAELDLDLHDWHSHNQREPLPFRFQVQARGGDVVLPRHSTASSVLAGVAGSALHALQLRGDQHSTERRPWFADLRAQGELQLAPWPKGQLRLDLAGLDLAALRGLAEQGGVALDGGSCDVLATTELRADRTQIEAGLVFTQLAVREPPNGPISTYLRLPAPLDTVLFLLRNDADEQRIPLQCTLPANGPIVGPLGAAAGEALALLIAEAVARSPLRVASAVTGLFGFGGSAPERRQVGVPFQAGATQPAADALLALLPGVAGDPNQQFVLEHELGADDLARLEPLANPTPAVVLAQIERLRQLRAERLTTRVGLAATAAAKLGAAQPDAPAALRALMSADAELGALELALDAALDQFDRHDDPRARAQRTRQAAQALGAARLAAVADLLRSRLPAGSESRIDLRPARAASEATAPVGQVQVVIRARPPQGKVAANPGAALEGLPSADRVLPPPGRR